MQGFRKGVRLCLVPAIIACLSCVPASASAAVTLNQVGNLSGMGIGDITDVSPDPTAPDRLFVTDRSSREIHLVQNGVVSNFLDLSPWADKPLEGVEYEKGVFSMEFPPDYAASRHFYVYYSTGVDLSGRSQIDEFTVDAAGKAIPSSRRAVLTIPHPNADEHWGGQIIFGPDGRLYISTGDDNDPTGPQNLNKLDGKILRIDPRRSGAFPYTIPSDNPIASSPTTRAEIWAWGLRNPWRFTFDKANGALVIGDVGDAKQEEVDYIPGPNAARGMNFGWPCMEGVLPHPGTCAAPSTTAPVFHYDHMAGPGGTRCAIIGGYMDRSPDLKSMSGRYLYADLCGDEVRSVVPGLPTAADDQPTIDVDEPTTFSQDICGRLYVVRNVDRRIMMLTDGGPVTTCVPPAAVPVLPDPGTAPRLSSRLKLTRSGKGSVRRGGRVSFKAVITPCKGRATGETVKLRVGKKQIAKKRLNRNCVAWFSVRIRANSRLRAAIDGDARFLSGASKTVSVKLKHERKHRRRHHS